MTRKPIRVTEYEGCLICGIKKGSSYYPDCKTEARLWGIELAEQVKTSDHIWTIMKEVRNWNGTE